MVQSNAKTPNQYLVELSPERRKAIKAVRKVIKKNLPIGYVETMGWGMLCYAVPLKIYPAGYGGKKDVPLPYLMLASQKNHMAIYLMNTYGNKKEEAWFKKAYEKTGKKLDMGKGCVRFRKLDDLALDVIGQSISHTPVKKFVKLYEATRKK